MGRGGGILRRPGKRKERKEPTALKGKKGRGGGRLRREKEGEKRGEGKRNSWGLSALRKKMPIKNPSLYLFYE